MVVKKGDGYVVKSKDGKVLSRVYKSRAEAVQRLREIEYFKHVKGGKK